MDRQLIGLGREGMRTSVNHAILTTAVGLGVIASLGVALGFKAPAINVGWLVFYLVISVPLQELLFRGVVVSRLERFGVPAAVVGSALIFSLIHVARPLLVVLTFVAGLCWGWSFLKARSLVGPVLSHMALGVALFVLVI